LRYLLWSAAWAAWVWISIAPAGAITTLQDAMNQAVQNHPKARMAQLRLESAMGTAAEQKSYAYNPELTIEPQKRRLLGGGQTNDFYLTLSQKIELGGKFGYRKAAAEASIDSATATKRSIELGLKTTAATAFVNLYFAEEADRLRQQISTLYATIVEGMKRQQKAGEASRLDVNLVQSAYASSLNRSATTKQALIQKRMEYFAAIGKTEPPELTLPNLPSPWHPGMSLDALVDYIWNSRPDLKSLRKQTERLDSLAQLAKAKRIPDISISASLGREAGDRLAKVGITVPFPILNTHQGAYQAALADEERLRTQLAWTRQRLHQEVENALSAHVSSTQTALALIDSAVIENSAKAIRLARKAYEAGEIEPEEMVFRIKQAVDAQIAAMETLRAAWLARIKLAEIIGLDTIIINNIHIQGASHETDH